MIAYPISTAKFYKTFRAVIGFFALKYNIEHWIIYELSVTQTRILSAELCLPKTLVFKNMLKEI